MNSALIKWLYLPDFFVAPKSTNLISECPLDGGWEGWDLHGHKPRRWEGSFVEAGLGGCRIHLG